MSARPDFEREDITMTTDIDMLAFLAAHYDPERFILVWLYLLVVACPLWARVAATLAATRTDPDNPSVWATHRTEEA